ncbi:hypothetical protein ACFS27_10005 [Promicromonospora vindobonensis]|uniref:Uncharacterized protein n=1 Tax=Promicromonospora vindobonensis TaxID=195748 RepID=A0ABW5VRD5_9MICO
MTEQTTNPANRARRLARGVAYGAPALLLAVAIAGVDFWPFSAYRLFSTVRSDATSSQQLVVSFADGTERAVSCVDHPVLRETMRFVPKLAVIDARTRDVMLDTWFADCDIDGADVVRVRIDRVDRTVDPVTHVTTETAVTTVWNELL